MAERSVLVRLKGDNSDYLRMVASSKAATDAFGRSTVNTSSAVDRSLAGTSRQMSGLAASALALGPALVPVGAAGVPALAGLSAQLGLTVMAAGVAVVAFKGLGDTLKTVNEYSLDPSLANFEKMSDAMGKLGPAGQDFVKFLQETRPEMAKMKRAAQEGMLPGVQEGLTSLMDVAPRVRGVIRTIASSLGQLTAEAGQGLSSDAWIEFFTFLQTTARPTLLDMGRSLGNVTTGLANMWMAFDPLSTDFSNGMLDMSRDFAKWSDELSDSDGFAEFVAYVREAGPAAGDALGAIGNAIVELVEAAAPVGLVVLPVVESLADAFAALAGSEVGPALVGAAVAFGTLNRAMAISRGLKGSALGSSILGTRADGVAAKNSVSSLKSVRTATDELRVARERLATSARTTASAQFALIPTGDKRSAVTSYMKDFRTISAAEQKLAAARKARQTQMLKMGAGIAAIGVATSGVADSFGLTNTATLALAGSMQGPLGTAAGAAAGLVLDVASASTEAEQAFGRASATFSDASSLTAQTQALADMRKQQKETAKGYDSLKDVLSPRGLKAGFQSMLGGKNVLDEQVTATGKADAALQKYQGTLESLKRSTWGADTKKAMSKAFSTEELDEFAAKVGPILDKAGLDAERVFAEGPDGKLWSRAQTAIADYNTVAGQAAAVTSVVEDAFAKLGDSGSTATEQANLLNEALGSVINPMMAADQAALNASKGWKDLAKALAEANGTVEGTSDASRSARLALGAQGAATIDAATKTFALDGNTKKLTKSLASSREKMIQMGVDAGIPREEVAKLADQMYNVPTLVLTAIKAIGAKDAQKAVNDLANTYNVTPKQLKTMVSQAGAAPTSAKIRALAKQYNLTPKQVKTLLAAQDAATAKIDRVKKKAKDLDATTAKPKIDVDAGNSEGILSKISSMINGLRDKTVNITTNRVETNSKGKRVSGRTLANGGHVLGPGGPRDDVIPAWLSNGEFVVNAAATARNLPLLHSINSKKFADGGQVGAAFGGYTNSNIGIAEWSDALKANTAAIAEQTRATNASTAAEAAVTRTGNALSSKQSALDNAKAKKASRLDILQQQQSIKDLQRQINTKKKGERLTGIDRKVAREQLAQARKELAAMRKSGAAVTAAQKAYNTAFAANSKAIKDAAKAAKQLAEAQAAAEAAQQHAQNVQGSATSVTSGASIGDLTSTAAVDRMLSKTIANVGIFTTQMGELRSRNASPWLLQQLDAAGPTDSAIKLQRAYLSDAAALAALNSKASLLSSVGTAYGELANNAKFLDGSSWGGAAQAMSQTIQLQVQALDVASPAVLAEIRRVVKHQIVELTGVSA